MYNQIKHNGTHSTLEPNQNRTLTFSRTKPAARVLSDV